MKPRALILISLAVVAMAAGWWAFSALRPSEPMVHGKRLSYWFTDAGNYMTNKEGWVFLTAPHLLDPLVAMTNVSCDSLAVREIGTNAIPTLLRLLRAKDTTPKIWFRQLLSKQTLIKVNLTSATNLNSRALDGFFILGPAASNAVPGLIELCNQPISEWSKQNALVALGLIGPAASNAVPAVVGALHGSSIGTHKAAIHTLANIDANLNIAIPVLIYELKNPSASVRIDATFMLREFGPVAKSAIPALRELAQDPDLNVSAAAKTALQAIDSAEARKAEEK